MSQSKKKRKQQDRVHRKRERVKTDPPNQAIIDSIGSPNAWTLKIADAWLRELGKISAVEIYSRFPPLRKPQNVSLRGKNHGG